MRITRIVALAIIAGTLGMHVAEAQSLRAAGPPAEFPPASYKGNQYVDSRGCVYIRAGIDGNVSWVPRVSRSRKQLCGYKPTTVAGTTASKPQGGPAPVMITLPEAQHPTTEVTATKPAKSQSGSKPPSSSVSAPAAPAVVTTAKPRRTPQTTSATTASTSQASPRRVVKPAPVPVPPVDAPPAAASGGCSGASALSQQYINQGPNVRCGPQAEPPVTYGRGGRYDQDSSLLLTPNTRLLPTHVYQERRLSSGLQVPDGYRPVWEDGRLNPHRGERTAAPAVLQERAVVPNGYIRVQREDDRMNTLRARGTPEGEAQMAEIWTNTVPRSLVRKPLDRDTVRLSGRQSRSAAEAREPLILRLSTRSDPAGDVVETQNARYVRAARFEDPAAARTAAQELAKRTGLPVRLGTVTRKGETYKVVLAGPFTETGAGQDALEAVRAAGYPQARLSK